MIHIREFGVKLIILLFFIFLGSCKKSSNHGMIVYNEADLYDAIIVKNNIKNPKEKTILNEFDASISLDSFNTLIETEKYTFDAFVNRDSSISKLKIRVATIDEKQIFRSFGKGNKTEKEIVLEEINCAKIDSILSYVLAKDQENRNENINPEIDHQNLTTVLSILKQCEIDDQSNKSENNMRSIFLVLQHNPLKYRLQYDNFMKEAVLKGLLQPNSYALFKDRLLMDQGKPQKYGTQVVKSPLENNWSLYPVENMEVVDSLRNSVGLGDLKSYLAEFDIE